MSNNKNAAKVTAESVAAQAAEENLVVPTQKNENSDKPVEVVEETTETTEVVEGDKKSFKERLVGVTEKLKENKKVVAGVAVSVALAAVAFAKFAAKQAVEAEPTETDPEIIAEAEQDDKERMEALAESAA